jgi:hypothetical protein
MDAERHSQCPPKAKVVCSNHAGRASKIRHLSHSLFEPAWRLYWPPKYLEKIPWTERSSLRLRLPSRSCLLGLAGYAVALNLGAFRGAVVVPSEAELV